MFIKQHVMCNFSILMCIVFLRCIVNVGYFLQIC